jgi:cobalt/nickel transport system permease protein
MEGFLETIPSWAGIPWWGIWWLIALPFLVLGVYQLNRVLKVDRETLPLLGVVGGFVFILSSLKLPSVVGSCSHPTGTGLPAICFGPWITTVISAIVLLFQALFLAHGGLSTMGANLVSMGIVGPLVGWGVYRSLRETRVSMYAIVFLACALADLFTYLTTSLELALAYPAGVGGVGSSFLVFSGIFALTQVPIALLEAVILVLVFKYIVQLRPGILIRLRIFPEEKIAAARSDI